VAIGRLEMAKRGIASAITEEEVDAFVRKLAKARQEQATAKNSRTKPSELRSQAKKRLVAKEARQYAKRFRQYDLRHSFVTRKLRAGVDSHIVAALVGHKDTRMIDSVYSHVADDANFMLDAAKKDVQPSPPPP
jgi:integrase